MDDLSSMRKTAILDLLQSVKDIRLEDDGLTVFFYGTDHPFGPQEFGPGSFTRELLELIERHMA